MTSPDPGPISLVEPPDEQLPTRRGVDSTDVFYAAFSPHAKDIRNDVANYTNLKPITQISNVRA